MKYRFDIEQNTDEWIALKIGKFSASTANELLMAKTTTGYQNLIDRIIEERFTGLPSESRWSGNEYTERGHELEPEAVANYEARHLCVLRKVGIVEVDDWVVVSPDRLLGDDKLYQAKCPIFKTQRSYLKSQKVPTNYYKQMQFELFATGLECDIFHSYHPRLPDFEKTIERDEKMIKEIAERLEEAKYEVTKEV